jgi:hypothetical protein
VSQVDVTFLPVKFVWSEGQRLLIITGAVLMSLLRKPD